MERKESFNQTDAEPYDPTGKSTLMNKGEWERTRESRIALSKALGAIDSNASFEKSGPALRDEAVRLCFADGNRPDRARKMLLNDLQKP